MADIFDEVSKGDIFDQVESEQPWIGQPRPESEGFFSSLYHMPVYGLQDIGAGAKHLTQEGTRRQGAHEIFTGLGEASVPAVAAGAAYALPVLGGAGLAAYLARLGLTLGTGTAGMALGRAGAGFMGADPETQALVGDVGAVAGGSIPSFVGQTRIGPVLYGMVRGAKEGALKKYQTQGGIIPGAIRGAVQAWENGSSIPAPPRPMTGTSDIPASIPMPPSAPTAAPTLPDVPPIPVITPEIASTLKATAKNMGAKSFQDLPEAVQKAVLAEVLPPPPGSLPTPGVSEAYKASVPQVSIIPEGEHNIIRRVAETNRGAKDTAIARSLKDEGFTAEKLDQMSDADLAKRVKDLGYRPSTGKNYSRTWQAFRRDLRSLLD